MKKKQITLEDGRYLVYFSFDKKKDKERDKERAGCCGNSCCCGGKK